MRITPPFKWLLANIAVVNLDGSGSEFDNIAHSSSSNISTQRNFTRLQTRKAHLSAESYKALQRPLYITNSASNSIGFGCGFLNGLMPRNGNSSSVIWFQYFSPNEISMQV
jgi:hypothetical protein